MNKGTVWVVNFADKYDFSPATRFGELKALTVGNVNVFDPFRLAFAMRDKLNDFDSEEDFLLLSGNNIISMVAISLIFSMGHEQVSCLLWSAKSQSYVKVVLKKNWDFSGETL